jgi:hypothetical protein
MFSDRRTRHDDKLFLVLLAVPAIFAGARFFETKSQMDQIALQSKPAVTIVANASSPTQAKAAAIVHRF